MKPPTLSPARLLPALLLLIAVLVLWTLGSWGSKASPTTEREGISADRGSAVALPTTPPGTNDQAEQAQDPGEKEAFARLEGISAQAKEPFLQVLDRRGKPVQGLRIAWRHADEATFYQSFDLQDPPATRFLGFSDAEGQVLLPQVSGGGVGFLVLDEDWLAIGETVYRLPFLGPPILRVMRGGTITGRVVDDEGPVSGASLGAMVTAEFLWDAHPDEHISELFFAPANYRYAKTDEEGRFRIGGLLPSSHRLDLFSAANTPERHEFEGPLPEEVRDIGTLTLSPGLTVTFEVQSEEPLGAGTRLYLESDGNYYCRAMAGLPLDEDSRLTIEGMRPGGYGWMVEPPDAVAMTGELVVRTEGVLSIEVPGLTDLVVEVTDAEGQPIPDFELEARERMGKPRLLQGHGQVQLRRGLESDLRIDVKAEGFVPIRRHRVGPHEDRVTLKLERYGSLDLHLPGLEDGTPVLAGLIDISEREAMITYADILPGYGMEERVVQGELVRFVGLDPGAFGIRVDHGGGSFDGGKVIVLPGETAEQTVELPHIETVTAVVVAAEDGRPLEGVEVSLLQYEDPSFFLSFAEALAFPTRVDRKTDAQGGFRFQVLSGRKRYLHLKHPQRLAVIESYPADDHRPVRIAMEKRPETPLHVEIIPGRPAAFAEISFARHDGWPALPTPLGHVSLDAEGFGNLDRSPGKALLQASFDWSPEVRYSLPYGEVDVIDGQELHMILLEDPGRLALTPPPLEGSRSLTIRPVGRAGFAPLKVRCKEGAWSEILPLPPGEYRIEASSEGREIYTTFRIHGGETATLDWTTEVQSFRVDLLGNDWTRAQLRAKVIDGPQEGAFRDIQLDATDSSWQVEAFPVGRVEVKLVEWWDQEGNGHRMSWTKELPPAEPVLRFSLENFAPVTVEVLDPEGHPVPQALVQLVFGRTGADGELSGFTDKAGRVRLLARRGALIHRTYKDGFKLSTQRRILRADETWTVQMRK